MSTFVQFKAAFDSSVNLKHIKCDWDDGHQYLFIDHPVMYSIDDVSDPDDQDQCHEYADEWLSESDRTMNGARACVPGINSDGSFTTACGCRESRGYSNEENIGYLTEFIDAVEHYACDQTREYYLREYVPSVKALIERLELDEAVETEVLTEE